jgi:putative heme-binding domain-containing protein
LLVSRSALWPAVTAFPVLALALALAAAPAAAQEHAGQYSQADINFGMRVYGETCVACHGPDGDAVDGVNFRTGQFRAASSDFALTAIIQNGIPDTAMPPGDYTAPEVTGLIAYLRTMGSFDPSDVLVGDADRGRALYRGKGDCSSCHRIGSEGSRAAPSLTDIGTIRTAGVLAETLVNPTAAMLPINRPVRAVTSDGTLITGRRLNEDTYTVQLINQGARLVSLDKADLREYTILTTSAMPSYEETMTEQERADVLAYLLTLRGIN